METIKTWQERMREANAPAGYRHIEHRYIEAEIADLRAAAGAAPESKEVCTCPCHRGLTMHMVPCCGPGSAHPEIAPPDSREGA